MRKGEFNITTSINGSNDDLGKIQDGIGTITAISSIRKSYKDFDYNRFYNPTHKKKLDTTLIMNQPRKLDQTQIPPIMKHVVDYEKMHFFLKAKTDILSFQLFCITQRQSLEQKAIQYFFQKYNKVFKELFKYYAGRLKCKNWKFGDNQYSAQTLMYHSEFFAMIKECGLGLSKDLVKASMVSHIIREVKMDKNDP